MRYRIEGTTDEVTSCDCCGRTRLKHTVALLDTDTDQVRYMGVVCAAHALKIPSADVRTQAKQADDRAARIKRQQQDGSGGYHFSSSAQAEFSTLPTSLTSSP
jgi:uncharacterized cysteine cluster protein YcgN (CxxCxxCC family)